MSIVVSSASPQPANLLERIKDIEDPEETILRFRTTHPETCWPDQRLQLYLQPCHPGLPLNVSASGQFSSKGWKEILETIHDLGPCSPEEVLVIDLRLESHGMLPDGAPIAWQKRIGPDRKLDNIDKSISAIMEGEKKWLTEIEGYTEEALVRSTGAAYQRVPIPTGRPPSALIVDELVKLFQSKQFKWLHFHDWKGDGRVTLVEVLHDIFHNATKDTLTVEAIMNRHRIIGGSDLTKKKTNKYKAKLAAERLALIYKFYDYCKEKSVLPFSQWVANKETNKRPEQEATAKPIS